MIFFFNLQKNLEQLTTIVIDLRKVYSDLIRAPEILKRHQSGAFITNLEICIAKLYIYTYIYILVTKYILLSY